MNMSILEIPVTLLRALFPFINKYYTSSSRHCDAYEHVWTGIVAMFLVKICVDNFSPYFYFAIIPISFLHIVLKEVIMDKNKRAKGGAEITAFHVDLTLRISGFLFGALSFLL